MSIGLVGQKMRHEPHLHRRRTLGPVTLIEATPNRVTR